MDKKTKILLFKLFLIFISVWLIGVAFVELFPVYYNNVNNTRWYAIKKTFDKTYDLSDTSVRCLFIGDSRPNAGIDFLKIDDCWSFCAGGTTPVENYYFLRKFIDSYGKPETVFVSISPRFLTQKFAFWDLAVRNGFFTKCEFDSIYDVHRNFNDTVFDFWSKPKFLLYEADYLKYYQEDIRRNLLFFGYSKNKALLSYIMTHRGSRPHPDLKNYCSDLNYETSMNDFYVAGTYDFYFNKIFETCAAEKIYCVFFPMPFNESSYKNLNPDFVSSYRDFIKKYAKKYPFFDISDTLYFYGDSLFGDASHLNEKGKNIFTEQFLEKYFADN